MNNNNSLKNIYESHHRNNRPENYSVLEKERADFFSDVLGKGKKILDIGCRNGVLTKHFMKGNDVLGVDIDEMSLSALSRDFGIRTIPMDLNGDWKELEKEKFDAIVAGEILEHLYYPEQVTEKIADHLVSSGIFVGSVPNAFSVKNRFRLLFGKKRHTSLGDPTHINHFLHQELKEILLKRFEEVRIEGLGRHSFLAKTYPSLFAFDLAFVCKVPKKR